MEKLLVEALKKVSGVELKSLIIFFNIINSKSYSYIGSIPGKYGVITCDKTKKSYKIDKDTFEILINNIH